MRTSVLFITICIALFSCKTITVDSVQTIASIPEDIELIKIPAGIYTSGEQKTDQYINYDYLMMKFPVTNLQYIEYLKEAIENGDIIITTHGVTGYYNGDKIWPSGIYEFVDFDDPDCRIVYYPPDEFGVKWNWFDGRKEGYDNHPVIEVTWFGANSFAEYYGMRLPTVEEWEKAARANRSYIFPWGNEFDSTKVNFNNSGDIYDNGTTPIGFYNGENNTSDSYSPYGIYDMAGNVWEWTNTWMDQSPGKIIKGGSWQSVPNIKSDGQVDYYDLYTWFNPANGYSPNNSSRDIGFRCIKEM